MGNSLQDENSHRVNLVRAAVDDCVDRPDVEAWQHVQLTGTNSPRACHFLRFNDRVHCAVPELRSGITTQLNRVSAAMSKGKRPVTFRTRKLSPSEPMVLHLRRCGRVGRRRAFFPKGVTFCGPFRVFRVNFVLQRRVKFPLASPYLNSVRRTDSP